MNEWIAATCPDVDLPGVAVVDDDADALDTILKTNVDQQIAMKAAVGGSAERKGTNCIVLV